MPMVTYKARYLILPHSSSWICFDSCPKVTYRLHSLELVPNNLDNQQGQLGYYRAGDANIARPFKKAAHIVSHQGSKLHPQHGVLTVSARFACCILLLDFLARRYGEQAKVTSLNPNLPRSLVFSWTWYPLIAYIVVAVMLGSQLGLQASRISQVLYLFFFFFLK